MTIGTGYFGRSSVSENVGPEHLIQWTRVAYAKDAEFSAGAFDSVSVPESPTRPRLPEGEIDYSFNWVGGRPSPFTGEANDARDPDRDDLKAEIRKLILEELRALQRERRGAT